MSPTKTDKKKAARKKPTQLDRIENAQKLINKRIDYYGNAIKFLEAWVPTLQGQLDELRGLSSPKHEGDAKKEEQGKWVPEKGGYVVRLADEVPTVGEIQYTVMSAGQVSVKWPSGICVHFARQLRPATQAEIDAHRESSAYGEREGLEEGEWTVLSDAGRSELLKSGLVAESKDTLSGRWESVEWVVGRNPRLSGNYIDYLRKRRPQAEIPELVFLRLAKLTAEKLRSAREEEEAKKKLEFGTRVQVKCSSANWVYLRPSSTDDVHHLLAHDDGVTMVARSEFRVLNN